LRRASKGLRYTSETDAPLRPFVWGEKQLADKATGTATLDSFFRAVPSEDKAKFQKLAQVLKEQLAEKHVYIVGATKDGRWAGPNANFVHGGRCLMAARTSAANPASPFSIPMVRRGTGSFSV
jgi:hypothetical protein